MSQEPQVKDALHEDLCIAGEVQRHRVLDDLIVGVGVKQHGHVAPGHAHLVHTRRSGRGYKHWDTLPKAMLFQL